MDESPIWQTFVQSAPVAVTPQQLERFQTLYQLVVEANSRFNLTRITSLEDFCTRHLLDSLTVAPLLSQGSIKLADVGSGAGFPALPLAIFREDIEVVAIESVQKKAKFIEDAAKQLGLNHLQVVAERSETLGQLPPYRESFDSVVARAVAPLNILVELCLPLLRPEGIFYGMKTTHGVDTELDQARHAIKQLGGGKVIEYNVSINDKPLSLPNRVIVSIEKQRHTPSKYPRRAGIPEKKPL